MPTAPFRLSAHPDRPTLGARRVAPVGGVRHDRGLLAAMLRPADIILDGPRAHDVRVNDARMFRRVLANGTLGVGDSYVDGWWDCDALHDMLTRALRADIDARLATPREALTFLLSKLRNPQSPRRAFVVGERHYDLGDDLYSAMLDRRMIYSCGYWPVATTLDAAQEAKLDLICRKLGLVPGMRVLDIGCGWGGAAQFAAERYGVEVTGITISRNQAESARTRCAGLPVTIELLDYRNLTGRFDRIWSVGMFEHVGIRNYPPYFETVRRLLAPDGLFLLHTIGGNRSTGSGDPWIEKHIFPNSMLPSLAQLAAACERHFVVEDWHGFGPDYDRTLMAWSDNFNRHWSSLAPRYGERFRRMWHFYLMASAATFRARKTQLWQVVLSPTGVAGGYAPIR